MPFRVSVEGQSFLTDDLTLDEACSIEAALGVDWGRINPLSEAKHCRAIVAAFLSRSCAVDEAAKKAGALSVRDALSAIEWVSDDRPDSYEDGLPLVEDARPTG